MVFLKFWNSSTEMPNSPVLSRRLSHMFQRSKPDRLSGKLRKKHSIGYIAIPPTFELLNCAGQSDPIQGPMSPTQDPFFNNLPPSPSITNSFWDKSSSSSSLRHGSYSSHASFQSSPFHFPSKESDLNSGDGRPSVFRPRQLTNFSEDQKSGSSFKKSSFVRKFTNRLVRSVSIHNGGVEPVCPNVEMPIVVGKIESAQVESWFVMNCSRCTLIFLCIVAS